MVLKNKRKIVINREKWKWHLGFSLAIVLINDRIRTVFVCKLSKIGAVNKNDRSQAGLGSETDWPNLSSSIQMVAFCEFSFHVNGRDFVSLFYPQVTQGKNEIFYTYCTYVCSCFRHMWYKKLWGNNSCNNENGLQSRSIYKFLPISFETQFLFIVTK